MPLHCVHRNVVDMFVIVINYNFCILKTQNKVHIIKMKFHFKKKKKNIYVRIEIFNKSLQCSFFIKKFSNSISKNKS